MPGSGHRWTVSGEEAEVVRSLQEALGVSRLLARCLVNRGVRDPVGAGEFLDPRLARLGDPLGLPGMEAAVERLLQARAADEPVVVFGDYDVDGVTATALLVEVLGRLGWKVRPYVPHRFGEGYGLTEQAVAKCLAEHPTRLLIAVDCGSTASGTIAWLAERGVDTVVLDHHQVAQPPPAATALVNPRVAGTGEGLDLCSVGLAFKLAHALVKRGRQVGDGALGSFDVRTVLDYVALGTVADLVPLRGENRILVSVGLRRLAETGRPGLRALMEVAGVGGVPGVHAVGYQLGPRLNAAGRLETASASLQLLLANDAGQAAELARQLDDWNRDRQEIERRITQEAVESVRARFRGDEDLVIVEGQDPWHIGVVGIVASRVLREFYRPTIILGGHEGEWRGSGRSIEGFDLAAALRECGDLLVRHGGHAMAAGVTLRPERLEAFRERLNAVARRVMPPEALRPPLRLDSEVRLDEVGLEQVDRLGCLEPVGQGNAPVQVFARGLRLCAEPVWVGKERQHAKLQVTDGATRCEAVWWNPPREALPVGRFDLAFRPQINDYQGRRRVQLVCLDWRAGE